MKRYLIATLILAAASTPALAAAGQHYVVEDTEKFCSVIDAAPSKNLKVLGDRHGYGSRDTRRTYRRTGRIRRHRYQVFDQHGTTFL